VHHMTGKTKAECRANVQAAFGEFQRVLKPGGHLFVSEVNPRFFSGLFQEIFWNLSKKILGRSLDQFFWKPRALKALGEAKMPGAKLTIVRPRVSPFTCIPPIFNKPWFKLPKLLHPLQAALFHWTKAAQVAVRQAA
jgi:hypothetical protein